MVAVAHEKTRKRHVELIIHKVRIDIISAVSYMIILSETSPINSQCRLSNLIATLFSVDDAILHYFLGRVLRRQYYLETEDIIWKMMLEIFDASGADFLPWMYAGHSRSTNDFA